MAPAGKAERFWEVTVAPQRRVPALCPSPPFPGTHVCPRTCRHTRVLSPGFLGRSPRSSVGRQSHRREQVEERLSGHVCDGRRGKGERPYGSREDCSSMGAVEVAGVRACACAWPKWGAKCHHFGEGQPHLGGVLPTGWLLGGLAPRLHLWPVCYVQKHPHACSQGTAGSTTVSHRVAQGNLSQRGVHALGGRAPDAPGAQAGKEGPALPGNGPSRL